MLESLGDVSDFSEYAPTHPLQIQLWNMATAYKKFGTLPSDYRKQKSSDMRIINEINNTINIKEKMNKTAQDNFNAIKGGKLFR